MLDDFMIRHRLLGERAPRDEDDIVPLFQRRVQSAHRFPEPALDLVPPYRFADAPANREAVAILFQTVRGYDQHEEPARVGFSSPAHPLEVARAAEPQPPRDHHAP